jgi:hypothetical protein
VINRQVLYCDFTECENNIIGVLNETRASLSEIKLGVRFKVFGVWVIEKEVKLSGDSSRAYLLSEWAGE